MANKNSVRKLPMNAVYKSTEQFKETVEIDLDVEGKEYRITLHPFFDPIKINKCIESLGKDLDAMKKNNYILPDNLFPQFLLTHILYEFSNFPPSKSKDVKVRVSYFKEVIKSPYYKECVNYLKQSEVAKVWERLMEVLQENENLDKLKNKLAEDLLTLDVQNPEIKKMIQAKTKRIPEA